MPLLDAPNELSLIIARYFSLKHLSQLLQTNHRLATLLAPLLHKFALQDFDGLPALHWAAQRGHGSLARLLLTNGAGINCTRGTVESTTVLAVKNGHEAMIKLLIENGVSIHAKDANHRTPLSWATGWKSEVRTRTLLENGGNPNDPS